MTAIADSEAFARLVDWGLGDTPLLAQALTHKSAVPNRPLESNERLEFLGDAILGMIINEHLFHAYPERREGELTKAKARVVCEPELAAAAQRLDLGSLLKLGRAEEATGGRMRLSVLSDCYEALVAVIYLEAGYPKASEFVLSTLAPALDAVNSAIEWRDPKTVLQERLHAKRRPSPVYRVVEESGQPHNRLFTVDVVLGGKVVGSGIGRTKQAAQKAAAAKALEQFEA